MFIVVKMLIIADERRNKEYWKFMLKITAIYKDRHLGKYVYDVYGSDMDSRGN